MEQQTIVSRWFGDRFQELHPLLQALHRRGGVLFGTVKVQTGQGLAGWLGRRLAASIGLPVDMPLRGFRVEISHTDEALVWRRSFDNGTTMISRFSPVGFWPSGYWTEETGPLRMRLTVDIVNQGWQWRPLRASFRGLRLPLWALPRSKAGKRIENGKYLFSVDFALPLVGKILSYGGVLQAENISEPS